MWAVYFILTESSPVEAYVEIGGAIVSVRKESKEICVTSVVADDQVQAIDTAQSLANMLLNKLSWGHGQHLEIAYVIKTERILANGEKKVEHIEPPIKYGASIEMQIARVGASGNVVEVVYDSTRLGKLEVRLSEAAPCYRRAQLATDPFDKFRNFYLVAENISSQIALTKKLGKLTKQQQLEAGLEECFRGQDDSLEQAAKAVPALDQSKPLIPEVTRILYIAQRCELNHSDATKSKKIPFNPQDEEEVQSALPLVEFVAKSLLEYEDRFLSGGSTTSP